VPHILLGIGGGAGTATSLARCGTGVAAGEEKHECVDGQDEVGGVAGSSLCEVGLWRRARSRRGVAQPNEVGGARLLVCVPRWRSDVLDP
jgi:hypothetical protein